MYIRALREYRAGRYVDQEIRDGAGQSGRAFRLSDRPAGARAAPIGGYCGSGSSFVGDALIPFWRMAQFARTQPARQAMPTESRGARRRATPPLAFRYLSELRSRGVSPPKNPQPL